MTAFVPAPCTNPQARTVRRKSSHPLRICTWRGPPSSTHATSLSSIASSTFVARQFRREGRSDVLRRLAVTRRVPAAVLGGGGFLGVGPAEVVVCVAVGWLFLGPEKLYSLSKDLGKILGDLRRTADEARDSFSDALDFEMTQSELEKTIAPAATTKDEQDDKKAASPISIDGKDNESDNKVESAPSVNEIKDGKQGAAELDHNNLEKEDIPQLLERPISEILEMETLESPPLEEAVHATVEETEPQPQQEANALFLDQLKRVSDPNQVAPSEIPDLDIGLDMEELEVQRLEQQYLEARARLDARKNTVVNTGGNSSPADIVDPPEATEKPSERKDVEPTSV